MRFRFIIHDFFHNSKCFRRKKPNCAVFSKNAGPFGMPRLPRNSFRLRLRHNAPVNLRRPRGRRSFPHFPQSFPQTYVNAFFSGNGSFFPLRRAAAFSPKRTKAPICWAGLDTRTGAGYNANAFFRIMTRIRMSSYLRACSRFPRRRQGKTWKINPSDRTCPVIWEHAYFRNMP